MLRNMVRHSQELDVSCFVKLKLRRNLRRKIVKMYANYDQRSKHCYDYILCLTFTSYLMSLKINSRHIRKLSWCNTKFSHLALEKLKLVKEDCYFQNILRSERQDKKPYNFTLNHRRLYSKSI